MAASPSATNKNALYDSYIRAIRWASDRIGEKGVIGFVTNGSYIDSNSADGLRKCLTEEFSSLYFFHLRGNQRTSGEKSRQEGGKIFGSGSRAPIVISILVKNPNVQAHGQIYFHDIGDYLSREEKLEKVSEFNSVNGITKINGWQLIEPDKHNDWLNQRDEIFNYFIEMGNKKDKDSVCIFSTYSRGVATSRDAWVYNFSAKKLIENVSEMIVYYNFQVNEKKKDPEFKEIIDTTIISWNRSLLNDFNKLKNHSFDKNCIYKSVYRPFNKSNLYLAGR